MNSSLRLGIDLGGTKIEIIALLDGQECLRRRVPTPKGDYDGTLLAICSLVELAERELGLQNRKINAPGTAANWLQGTGATPVDGALTTILGREAALRRTRLTMAELLKENKRLEPDLRGLKT